MPSFALNFGAAADISASYPNWTPMGHTVGGGGFYMRIKVEVSEDFTEGRLWYNSNNTQGDIYITDDRRVQYRNAGTRIESAADFIQDDTVYDILLTRLYSPNRFALIVNGSEIGQTTYVTFNGLAALNSIRFPSDSGDFKVYEFELFTSGSSYSALWDGTTAPSSGTEWLSTDGQRTLTVSNAPVDNSQWVPYGEPSDDIEITPETGVYSYAGGGVSLALSRALIPQGGVYSYTGGAVELDILSSLELTPEGGVYSYAGGNVPILVSRTINPVGAVYSYSGGEVQLGVDRVINPTGAVYSYQGGTIPLQLSRAIQPQGGVYSYAGGAVELDYDADTSISLTPEPGIYSYQGGDVPLTLDRAIMPDGGVYSYLGGDVNLTTGISLLPAGGVYSYLGGDVQLTLDRAINPETGAYSYAGGAIIITYSGLVIRRVTNYSVNYEQDFISARYEPDFVSARYEDIR